MARALLPSHVRPVMGRWGAHMRDGWRERRGLHRVCLGLGVAGAALFTVGCEPDGFGAPDAAWGDGVASSAGAAAGGRGGGGQGQWSGDPTGGRDAGASAQPGGPTDASGGRWTLPDGCGAWGLDGGPRPYLPPGTTTSADAPSVLWRTALGQLVLTTRPVSDGEAVFVRTMHGAAALSVETGEFLWFAGLPGYAAYDTFVFHDGAVITTDDSKLVALDRESGAILWTSAEVPDLSSFGGMRLDGSRLTLGGSWLEAFDLVARAPLWVEEDVVGGYWPALDGGRLYLVGWSAERAARDASLPPRLVSVDAATGAVVWRSAVGVPMVRTSPVVSEGSVIIAGPSVYSFAAETGALQWETPIAEGSIGGDFDAAVSVSGGRAFAVGDAVYSLDVGSGGVVWRHPGGNQRSTPALSAGALIVNDSDEYSAYGCKDPPGRLLALDPIGNGDGTTSELWSVLVERSNSSPIIVGDTILFAQMSGAVIALR